MARYDEYDRDKDGNRFFRTEAEQVAYMAGKKDGRWKTNYEFLKTHAEKDAYMAGKKDGTWGAVDYIQLIFAIFLFGTILSIAIISVWEHGKSIFNFIF